MIINKIEDIDIKYTTNSDYCFSFIPDIFDNLDKFPNLEILELSFTINKIPDILSKNKIKTLKFPLINDKIRAINLQKPQLIGYKPHNPGNPKITY
jgi:hypothetical protein